MNYGKPFCNKRDCRNNLDEGWHDIEGRENENWLCEEHKIEKNENN